MKKSNQPERRYRRWWSVCVLAALALPTVRADRTLFVGSEGDAIPPYLSWDNAATSIHDAVAVATNTDVVLVADGTYTLTNEVTISTAITLRSVNGPEATFINANGPVTANRAFFLKQADAVIEGFTITNGVAVDGGGVYVQAGTLCDSIVSHNSSTRYGGGIFATGGSILNCLISTNTAPSNSGGGVYFNYGFNTLLRNCRVVGNQTALNGAGMYCNRGGLIENCLIVGNTSTTTGASQGGGGAYLLQGGRFRNCTISGNTGRYGGGLLTSSGTSGTGVVHNTIIYYNTADYYTNIRNLGNIVISNSCYTPSSTSGVLGSGNLYTDPLFADRAAGDYRLTADSLCINAGVSMDWMAEVVDLDGNRRIDGLHKVVDLGCYEYPFAGSTLIIR